MIYKRWSHTGALARKFCQLQNCSFGPRTIPNLKVRRFFSSDTSGVFKDRIVLTVTGGTGGSGCLSFSRAPNQEFAPPDGGNGGDGGSVWIRVDPDCRSLRQSTTTIRAAPGSRGMPAKSRGRAGDDLFIPVPPGTVVYEFQSQAYPNTDPSIGANHGNVEGAEDDNDSDSEDQKMSGDNSGQEENEDDPEEDGRVQKGAIALHKLTEKQWDTMISNLEFILKQSSSDGPAPLPLADTTAEGGKILVAELNSAGESIKVAAGGRGGRGNVAYKSSSNRAPQQADAGAPGEKRRLELVLKTIADVGLVGLPNAGKSTLLRAISHAKPKVAAYPFTTLQPHIGVMNATPQPGVEFNRTITVADIPGLIEGAHEDRGLGHDFLRHIERTSFLVYVIDVAGAGSVDPCKALRVLREELELHLPGLSSRAGCIIANKMDGGEQARKNLIRLIDEVGDISAVFPVSAKFGIGVDAVIDHLSENVHESPSVMTETSE